MDKLDEYIEQSREQYERQLAELVAIPTVSADPAHRRDIAAGAHYAVRLLQAAGLSAEVVATDGNPVVYGEATRNPAWPRLTLYNHLDVQPAEGADWKTNPFELVVRDGTYRGRGATDDKGPALAALMAVRYALETKMPVNISVIWELEEEIGSPHFEQFIRSRQAQLVTNSILVSDTIWIRAGKPAIPYGLRGVLSFEVSLVTGAKDVHSGLVGGAARNPIGELAQLTSECYDARTGRVLIPGFYDDVVPASPEEVAQFVESGFTTEQFVADHELQSLRTTEAREVLRRVMAEPTFEVHGIVGGYAGPGVKMIVPAQATAKLSCRLVPNQDPARVFSLIKGFIQSRQPDAVVRMEAGARPYLADIHGPYAAAARTACREAFAVEPAFVREGGSIGAVITMQELLRAPVMMLGLSLPEHGYHAPDEYFDWRQASGGMKMFARYFEAVARIGQ